MPINISYGTNPMASLMDIVNLLRATFLYLQAMYESDNSDDNENINNN